MPYQERTFSWYFSGLPTRAAKFFVLSKIQNPGFKKNAFQNFSLFKPIQPELSGLSLDLGPQFHVLMIFNVTSMSRGFDI